MYGHDRVCQSFWSFQVTHAGSDIIKPLEMDLFPEGLLLFNVHKALESPKKKTPSRSPKVYLGLIKQSKTECGTYFTSKALTGRFKDQFKC